MKSSGKYFHIKQKVTILVLPTKFSFIQTIWLDILKNSVILTFVSRNINVLQIRSNGTSSKVTSLITCLREKTMKTTVTSS